MGDENNEGLSPEQIESNYLKHSKEHALRASLKEGCNQSIGVNMSSGFLTPLLLALGGNSFHVGLMTSLNGLFDPAGEIYGSKLMEKHSRKKLWMHAKFWVVLLQLPTLMLIYFAWKGILAPILPWALLAIWGVIIPFIYGAGYVSFLSWLGDLVPQERKGKFFASRNRIIGMVGLVTLIVSGFLLDLFKTRGYILLGFTFLFAFAVIFRMASVHYTNKIFNPYFRVKKQSYFSLIAFLKRFDNFGKFTVFQFFFYFAMMLSAPFFAVRMLEELHFGYLTYTIVSISSTVFYLLFAPLAGKFSDKYGNLKLIYFGALMFPVVPILWMFFDTPISLIFIPGVVSGLANAGFVIGTTSFTYNATSEQKRARCFAYSALLVGLGTLVGSFVGGVMIEYLSINWINSMFFTFIVSSILMIIATLWFLPKLTEGYRTKFEPFHFDAIKPGKTINSAVIWVKGLAHWQPHISTSKI
jgi:MFS family permease